MSAPDELLQRAYTYLGDARDLTLPVSSRAEALDAARAALLDARRAGATAQHLLPVFNSICRTSVGDTAYQMRIILPQVVEDMCLRELRTYVSTATPFLEQSFMDSQSLVIKRAVRTLTTLFRKFIGLVVSVGIGSAENQISESHLNTWLQMHHKTVSLINEQDEGLRNAATKFIETVVLAFSYSGSSGSADHFTLDYIIKKSFSHPLLNAQVLENEGFQGVKAVAHLVRASLQTGIPTRRPDGTVMRGLPPTSFMTALTVLSNLVRRRKKLLSLTLPPLLNAVGAITGSTMPPSPAFISLTTSQQKSITSVLRYSLQALRAYQHTRSDRAGEDVNRASNDLVTFENEQERLRRERAARAQEMQRSNPELPLRPPSHRPQPPIPIPDMKPVPPMQPPQLPLKRPRPFEHNPSWARLSANEAIAVSQNILRQMPPKEVVNFIMTRILLNIPPAESIPGALPSRNRTPNGVPADSNLPPPKKPKRSRFATREAPSVVASVNAPKKVVPVQRKAPPVIPARLSSTAVEKLAVLCCRRIMRGEAQAAASGAGPLRVQLLARLLSIMSMADTEIASTFCTEISSEIAGNIRKNLPLALAWLHSLVVSESLSSGDSQNNEEKPQQSPSAQTSAQTEQANSHPNGSGTETSDAQPEPMVIDSNLTISKDQPSEPPEKQQNETDKEGNLVVEKGLVEPTESDEKPPNGTAKVMAVLSTVSESESDSLDDLEDEKAEPLSPGPAYEKVLSQLLNNLTEIKDISNDDFSKVLTEAPMLPSSVFQFVKNLCLNPSLSKLGLHALHAIVEERSGGDRKTCLSQLFQFTSHEDEVVRGPTIRLLTDRIFVDSSDEVRTAIQDYAEQSLRTAVEHVSIPSESEQMKALQVQSLLLTALCAQKHELVKYIADCYLTASPDARRVLLMRLSDLAAHVGMKSKPLLQLIEGNLIKEQNENKDEQEKVDTTEDLALGVLQALLKKYGKPTTELVQAALTRFERRKNTEFLIAVLPGLSREALLQNLEGIVMAASEGKLTENGSVTDSEDSEKTRKMKDIIGKIMSERSPALKPAEFLVELHKIPGTEAVGTAIRACFEMKGVYKQEIIAQAIEQLMEITSTPDLFMQTVHLVRDFYPEREKYLTKTVMKRLLDRRVWTKPLVWEGFLSYCANIREKSLSLLVALPLPQLKEALQTQPVLKKVSEEYVAKSKKIPPKLQKAMKAFKKKASA